MSFSHTVLSDVFEVKNKAQLHFLIDSIFDDDDFVQKIEDGILNADPKLQKINTVNEIIKTLKSSFQDTIDWKGFVPSVNTKNLYDLTLFEERVLINRGTYVDSNKPKPNACFWPNPQHKKYPQSRFDIMPYVLTHPLIDKNTPIGSAGSCFAIEIAKVLQQREFNYIITERADDIHSGVLVDGYKAGSQYAPGSFNSGIQFNTGNFRHLAEKAFFIREFKKILIKQRDHGGNEYFVDPYREDVFFLSEEAYENDYEKHRNAIKEAFLACEVFILTPGLNECWQFADGTVMARNPRSSSYPYARQKTMTVAENVENIQQFFDIVRKHNPNFKLILSLSPVPFLATARGQTHHVIEANCHSKAVLRVAIEELVTNNKDIYYLPSYEYVTYCSKEPWMDDDRHVKPEVVANIMTMFEEMYFK